MTKKNKKKKGNNLVGTAMKFIRIGALAAPAIHVLTDDSMKNDPVPHIIWRYTGYNMGDGTFQMEGLKAGWMPYLMAVVTTRVIPKISSILRKI